MLKSATNSAVVFAYHDVGVRCLKTLLDAGVSVSLVVTHTDNPKENIWFQSVKKTAEEYGLPVVTPENPNAADFIDELKSLAPDFLFSFYYRHMLSPDILAVARRGAFNMHGSLLPHYRGRVPVNWAIFHGETQTGATLHMMTAKPDAGDIVDQEPVPILVDDVAHEVFQKVAVAAEIVLKRSIGSILSGDFPRRKNDLEAGSYFGGRKPEDGRIDLNWTSQQIYNLIRAVAPPYPGAFLDTPSQPRFFIYRALLEKADGKMTDYPVIFREQNGYYLQIAEGTLIKILECGWDGQASASAMAFFASNKITLPWRLT